MVKLKIAEYRREVLARNDTHIPCFEHINAHKAKGDEIIKPVPS